MTTSSGRHFQQLDALRGIAALMVVFNHFALVGPLRWIWKSPLRLLATGHEAVILFFILSGFVLTLQLTSIRRITFRDYLIKRVCRIYFPYLVVLLATFSVINSVLGGPVSWAGPWINALWDGPLSRAEITNHLLFVGKYRADHVIPVIWSLVYEMRISVIFPLVVYLVARASVRMCIGAAVIVSAASLALVVAEGANPTTANIDTDWVMTAHYVAIFIVGATLAVHRTAWQRWMMQGKRAFVILTASLALYFLSRSAILVLPVAIGQFTFDWGVAAGAAGIICAAMVSRRFTAALAVSPVMFLGKISYSLYLTHTVVLLAILHLMPFPDQVWPALATAAMLAIPVAAASYFLVERPSMMLGQFLTGRTTAAPQANRTP